MTEWIAVLYALYVFGLELGLPRSYDERRCTRELAAIEQSIAEIPRYPLRSSQSDRFGRELDAIDTIWRSARTKPRYGAILRRQVHEQMPINGIVTIWKNGASGIFPNAQMGARSVVMVIAPPVTAWTEHRRCYRYRRAGGGHRRDAARSGLPQAMALSILVRRRTNSFRLDLPPTGAASGAAHGAPSRNHHIR